MSRRDIYYWKCDRPAGFHGTQLRGSSDAQITQQLEAEPRENLGTQDIVLSPGTGQ